MYVPALGGVNWNPDELNEAPVWFPDVPLYSNVQVYGDVPPVMESFTVVD